jgi:hypothetical protein
MSQVTDLETQMDSMQIDASSDEVLDFFNLPIQFLDIQDKINKTDDNQTLQIYSYNSCTNQSSDKVKACRGLIFEKDILVAGSLGYTNEYNEDSLISEISDETLSSFTIFPSEEGTLVRVYCYNNTWYISTHRKLDAFKSRWGSGDSFGDIFLKYIGGDMESFTSGLEKYHVYFFLIRNTKETRLVSNPPSTPVIYYVGALLHNENFDMTTNENIERFGVQRQRELHFNSVDEIQKYVRECNPLETQGVILFRNDGSGKNLKIVTSRYQNYSRVRNNEPDLTFRFFQLWKNRHLPIFTTFLELYPECQSKIVLFDSFSVKIATYLQNMYFKKFVKKEKLVFNKDEWNILKNVHSWYWQDREHRKVTFDVMYKMMMEEINFRSLYQLFKRLN